MTTKISRNFSVELCRTHFKDLFVFGDNEVRMGMGGTAQIREQRNAIGIASKKLPSNDGDAFWTDKEYEENCKIIDEDIQRVKDYAIEIGAQSYVFPYGGIGNGLAMLPVKAPLTYCYLVKRLIEEFQFNNLAGVFKHE